MRSLGRIAVLAALGACGRIGFDRDGDSDARPPIGDARIGDSNEIVGDASIDASPPQGDVCADVIMLQAGVTLANQTIAGASNNYSGNLCGDGPEVVFRFMAPVAGNRRVDLSTGFYGSLFVGTACPPVTGACNAFGPSTQNQMNPQMAAGVNYLILDRTSGAGTAYTITIP